LTNTLGAIPRTFNTAAAQIPQAFYTVQGSLATGEYGAAVEEYNKALKTRNPGIISAAKAKLDAASARNQQATRNIQAANQSFQENKGGLFGAGTIYNAEDAAQGTAAGAKKIVFNTAESMADAASLGLTGIGVKTIGKLGFKEALKQSSGLIAKNALANAAATGSSTARLGGSPQDVIASAAVGGAAGAVFDVGLASVGSVFYKPLTKLFSKGSKKVATKTVESIADYLVGDTDPRAIQGVL